MFLASLTNFRSNETFGWEGAACHAYLNNNCNFHNRTIIGEINDLFWQVHEWPIGNDTMKSKMEIDPATQKDAGYYECQADNQYAVDRRGFRTDYVMISY